MRRRSNHLCRALLPLWVLALLAASAPWAWAAAYQNGTYTVPFRVDGLGRHNIAWDTASVTVADGAYYVDFTLERVEPRDHAPRYDWVATECGTYYPEVDDAAFTCTFRGVQVPHLGSVAVSAQSSAMSQPHALDYTLYIDDGAIPQASGDASVLPARTGDAGLAPAAVLSAAGICLLWVLGRKRIREEE